MKQWKTQHQMSNSQYDQYCRADSIFWELKNETLLQTGSSVFIIISQLSIWLMNATKYVLSPFHAYHLVSTCLLFGDQLVIPLKSLWSHPMSRFEILVIFVRKLWKSSYCPVTQDFQVLARNFESMYCSIPATH